jgi:hypothetical protein
MFVCIAFVTSVINLIESKKHRFNITERSSLPLADKIGHQIKKQEF